MANYYNLVLQGGDDADTLKAHVAYNAEHNGLDYFTIVYGAGGNDRLGVDPYVYESRKGVKGVELYGEDGDDIITGQGRDTLSGGAGDDIITASHGIVDGGEGSDRLRTKGTLTSLTITGIEQLEAVGSLRMSAADFDAFESITLLKQSSLLFADATILDGSKLVGSYFDLKGSTGGDIFDLSTVTASVRLQGSDGDDQLYAGAGRALLDGGDGNDQLHAGAGAAVMDGGDGDDQLFASAGKALLVGGDGNDRLVAGSGNASIVGGNGEDDIAGGVGNDKLNGGTGNDTISGGNGNDLIIAEIGNDWVKGGDGNDKISGTVIYDHTNHPIKTNGDKMFDGGAGNDLFENLDGLGDFRATLVGGQGNDTLQFHGDASNLSVEGIETLEITLKIDRDDLQEHLPIKASGEFLESFEHISSDRRVGPVEAQIELTSSEFHWRDQHSSLFGDIYGTNHADEIDMSKARKYWTITSGNGDDVLTAGSAGAEFYAGGGNDRIIGGSGGGEIHDGTGNDIIDGRGGKDTFYEQDGANTFIFEAGSGTDYLYGFDTTGNGKDKIDLSAVKSISNYSDLIAHHVDEKFSGLSIEFSDKDRVWLNDFTKEMLDSSLFIF